MILTLLFGCTHKRQTRVFTIGGRSYTVCLSCGKELAYSWRLMRSLTRAEQKRREKRGRAA